VDWGLPVFAFDGLLTLAGELDGFLVVGVGAEEGAGFVGGEAGVVVAFAIGLFGLLGLLGFFVAGLIAFSGDVAFGDFAGFFVFVFIATLTFFLGIAIGAFFALLAVFAAFTAGLVAVLTLIAVFAFVAFFSLVALVTFIAFVFFALLLLLLLFLLFLEFVEAFLDEVAIFEEFFVIGIELEGGVEVAEGVSPGFDGELGLFGHGAIALIVEGVAEAVVGILLESEVRGFEGLGEGTDGGVELLELVGGAAEAEGDGGALLGAGFAFEAFAVEFGSGFEVIRVEGAAGFAGFLGGGV
jgi:hypothetical protein